MLHLKRGSLFERDSLPVFNTNLVRIGMMICFDFFPEVPMVLSRKGADIIFCKNELWVQRIP
ncbi:hypothetical protein KEJ19_03475 [Candidatus Bathyarchaeota archaeon]|nr:hypothetical protein [Candidatus Bathyarchaeota archaeon]